MASLHVYAVNKRTGQMNVNIAMNHSKREIGKLQLKLQKVCRSKSTLLVHGCSSPDVNIERMVTSPHKYPSPGWLGTSSYQTLFDHIPIRDYGTPTSHVSECNYLDRPLETVATMANMSHG
ncbi:hypothetical protein FOWG_11936 [Fusarium oxysporum f. sp. lycopersici MN25]|nr:hypothetical protein FOWG_11936 [Fusarium oxysporum f. sp. lycopersici MN25]